MRQVCAWLWQTQLLLLLVLSKEVKGQSDDVQVAVTPNITLPNGRCQCARPLISPAIVSGLVAEGVTRYGPYIQSPSVTSGLICGIAFVDGINVPTNGQRFFTSIQSTHLDSRRTWSATRPVQVEICSSLFTGSTTRLTTRSHVPLFNREFLAVSGKPQRRSRGLSSHALTASAGPSRRDSLKWMARLRSVSLTKTELSSFQDG